MKIRKFRAGDTVVDTSDSAEAKDKAAGLAASNAEKKSSGFLGLGRLFEGNIDEKGSEAYNKYGAGYGRGVEAENTRLKEITEREAADDAKRISDAARDAENARSEARIKAADKKIADIKERATAAESESDYRGPMQRRKLDVSEPAKAPAATRSVSTVKAAEPADSRTAEAGNSRGSRAAEPADSRTAEAGNSRGSRAADSRTAEAGNSRGSRAASAAKPAAAPAPAPAPAPAEDPYADDTSLSLAERRKRAEMRAKRGSTTGTNLSSVNERFKNAFKAKGGAIQSYAKGGSVSASSRGDGIAQRGKTRGRMC